MKNKNIRMRFLGTMIISTVLGGIFSLNNAYAAITAPTDTGLPSTTPTTLIANIIKLVMGMIGAIAVLVIVIAGVMYMTSGGDQGRTETAKNWIVYAIVGLVVSIMSYMIVHLTVGVF